MGVMFDRMETEKGDKEMKFLPTLGRGIASFRTYLLIKGNLTSWLTWLQINDPKQRNGKFKLIMVNSYPKFSTNLVLIWVLELYRYKQAGH